MVDRTVSARVKRQRDLRIREGWQDVRVWVPSEKDAVEIRALAERMRARAESLEGLKEGVSGMDANRERAIADAISQQGSPAYSTPSGPVLTLLSELAERGDLRSFSNAFVAFARAKPVNASYVEASVPAKILNQYFCRRHGVTVSQFERWRARHPNWAEDLKDTVREPARFEMTVESMLARIQMN
jgi:hypothetical protein